jgi:hypothetical protein
MQPASQVSEPVAVATLELSRLTSALSTLNDAPMLQVPGLLAQVAAAQTALAAAQACLVARMLSPRDSSRLECGEDTWLAPTKRPKCCGSIASGSTVERRAFPLRGD